MKDKTTSKLANVTEQNRQEILLDAKNSPLALLAQTCSQIGADPPAAKSLLASITASATSAGGSSSSSSGSSSCRDEEGQAQRSASVGSRVTPPNKSKPGHGNIKGSSATKKSSGKQKEKISPGWISSSETKNNKISPPTNSSFEVKRRSSRSEEDENNVNEEDNFELGGAVDSKIPLKTNKKSPSPSSCRGESKSPSSEKSGKQNSNHSSPPPPPPPVKNKDKLTLTSPPVTLPSSSSILFPPSYPISSSSSALVPPLPPTTIPPYLHSYARLKAAAASSVSSSPDGSSLLAGSHAYCRDPFCPGCTTPLGAAGHHLNSLAKCASGGGSSCVGCDHSNKSGGGIPPYFPPLFHPGFLYPPPVTVTTPYICNWISAGESYCGKRFGTSEELLQHLRTHTTNNNSSAVDLNLYGSRSYPTPPLSPISAGGAAGSAGARYHPYAKPAYHQSQVGSYSSLFPFLGGQQGSSFAALAAAMNNPLSPYFPYALYGHRLGGGGGGNGGMGNQ
ncbi:Zinc finger protein Elbow [Folsomia candida]|uniref:Zinc finger protein Elbow n=1 Tax=Folsomia candida TaxID=158441 RepID=A0A226DEU0_FOLCA|nr:Zinc finger protein Elbow [Folsomia candida]